MSQATTATTRRTREAADARFERVDRAPRASAVLRVVPSAIERSGRGAFAVACVGLLALGLITLLLLSTVMAQGSFQVASLQSRSNKLADTTNSLKQQLDAHQAPGALAQKATSMGMVPAQSMAFIRLSDGAIIGVAEAAKPNQALTVVVPAPAAAPVGSSTASATAQAPAGAAGTTAQAAPSATPTAPTAPSTTAAQAAPANHATQAPQAPQTSTASPTNPR